MKQHKLQCYNIKKNEEWWWWRERGGMLNNTIRSIRRKLFGTKKSPLISKLKNNAEKQNQIEIEVEALVQTNPDKSKADIYIFLTRTRNIKQKDPYFKSQHWINLKSIKRNRRSKSSNA